MTTRDIPGTVHPGRVFHDDDLNMNLLRLLSPDRTLGRSIVGMRTMVELAFHSVWNASTERSSAARIIRHASPRHTMISATRLMKLYEIGRQINRLGVPGDIVECGVWNGGSAALLAAATSGDGPARPLWLFDTFRGIPAPGVGDGPTERVHHFEGFLHGSIGAVRMIFRRLRLDWDRVRVIPGRFEETLPTIEANSIALLHVDADWYASVRCVLDRLFEKVVEGGFVVLDDYGRWSGCRRATEEFLDQQGIDRSCLVHSVTGQSYFRKPRISRN